MALTTKVSQFSFLADGIHYQGSPLVGGKVYFHEPGDSSTPKTVWADVNKSSAITNITLDSNGRGTAFGDGTYGITIKTSGDVELYTVDPYRVHFGGVTNIVTVSGPATYNASVDDGWILCDTTGGDVTVNLPTAASMANHDPFFIKKISSDAFSITIDPDGAETIDGSATAVFDLINYTLSVISDGSAWYGGSDSLDSDTVDGIHAADVAIANYLLALDGSKKFPNYTTGKAPLQDDSVRTEMINQDVVTTLAGYGLTANGDTLDTNTYGIIACTVYTANDTFSKNANTKWIEGLCIAGGGGGGGASGALAGGGGGSGGMTYKTWDASSFGSSETITVGAGGTGGGANLNLGGTAGGTSSIGSLLSAGGGGGGTAQAAGTAGGAGGTASTGLLNEAGNAGAGASVAFNAGGAGDLIEEWFRTFNTTTYGTGGDSGDTTTYSGGLDGAQGVVVLMEWGMING